MEPLVPLPGAEEVKLTRPDAGEVAATARGIASVVAPTTGLTDLQRVLLEALFPAMTDHPVDLADLELVSVTEAAAVLAPRNLQFRTRVVQVALLAGLILRPLPHDVVDRIERYARALGVDEGMVGVAHDFAAGSFGLAAVDFQRNGYTSDWAPADRHELHTSTELASAWDLAVDDPTLADRWAALGSLPEGTLGRGLWQLYRARGFAFPGLPGSAPPLLAQHDWVHVLADYGTTVESELEVFAFIARANDDMRAFSLLAMVISLFETGYLRTGAGLFQSDPGHLSVGRSMALRVADAMRRGAWCHDNVTGNDSIDYLRQDWFDLAPLPLDEVRARFCVRDKASEAVEAGSVGPWERGGISPFQLGAGRDLAARESRTYEAYGAQPSAKA
jgi:hypothetical protein